MADFWSLVSILFGTTGASVVVWLGLRSWRRQTGELVQAIKARGTITIVQTDEGEPCCPHCGHSLRSEG